MEFMKKKILQKTKIEKITSSTGDTYVILPDLTVEYGLKFSLTAEIHDEGIFECGENYSYSGYYGSYTNEELITMNYPIGLENLLTE